MNEQEDFQTTATEETKLTFDDLRIGYIVGLTKEGNFVFQLVGQERGLIELLGINQFASNKVQTIYNEKQLSGDRLVHEVGKAISSLNQKLDRLLLALSPSNKI